MNTEENQVEQDVENEGAQVEFPLKKKRNRRIWKISDFYLDLGSILQYRTKQRDESNPIECKVVDDRYVIIQLKDGSDQWVRKTLSAAMKIADKRIRGENVGGKTTPPFQTKWLYKGETLERRRLRILEDMAKGEDEV